MKAPAATSAPRLSLAPRQTLSFTFIRGPHVAHHGFPLVPVSAVGSEGLLIITNSSLSVPLELQAPTRGLTAAKREAAVYGMIPLC